MAKKNVCKIARVELRTNKNLTAAERGLLRSIIRACEQPQVIGVKEPRRARGKYQGELGTAKQSRTTQRILEKKLFGPGPGSTRRKKARRPQVSRELPPSQAGNCPHCGDSCSSVDDWTCPHCGVTYPGLGRARRRRR